MVVSFHCGVNDSTKLTHWLGPDPIYPDKPLMGICQVKATGARPMMTTSPLTWTVTRTTKLGNSSPPEPYQLL